VIPPFERFMSHVEPQADGCWLWTASKNHLGYGQWAPSSSYKGSRQAHRWSYEWLVGPIPEGLVLDHLCRTPLCVNPDHLEPVTQRENVLRGRSPQAVNARKTHCIRGHEFTPENTYIYQPGNRRACATCVKAAQKARRDAKRKPTRSTCADCGASLRLVTGRDGTTYWWGSNTSMFCEARKPHAAAVDLLEQAS
jgi:hypothetical protein